MGISNAALLLQYVIVGFSYAPESGTSAEELEGGWDVLFTVCRCSWDACLIRLHAA